jgi:hypothetical protein
MRGFQLFVFIAAAMMLTAACGSSTTAPTTVTAQPSTVTVRETPTAAAAPAPALVPEQAPPATVAASSWTMPNLVGKDLQAAQDAIQALTDDKVFFSGSTDLTGESRMQINDRNWQVCTSTPPAGTDFTAETSVSFGVVKESESCP